MAPGPKIALTVYLTPADRETLLAWQQAHTLPSRRARRARIILLRGEGRRISAIARRVGIGRPHVYKWVQRFLAAGIAGLENQPRHDSRRAHASPDGDPYDGDAHAQGG